jgi:HEAT repeat protein
VLGALGFAAAWVPALWLVGVVLAGLGFLLGACVLLWAMPRGASASGFPMAGTAVSLQGLIVAGTLLWLPRSPGPAAAGEVSDADGYREAVVSAPGIRDVPQLLARKDLGKVLTRSDDRLSRETATALGDIAAALRESVAELTEALNHKESSVRSAAADALGRLGPSARGAYPTLVYLSRQDSNSGVKETALLACERIGKPSASDVILLCEGLKDSRRGFRASVAQALGSIAPPPPQARRALREALKNDDDARVRVFAAQTLWALKCPADEVLPVLIAALEGGESGNRALAANALAQMNRSALPALPSLKKGLTDKDPHVCFYSAYAVWVIQEQASVVMPALINLLDEKDTSLRGMTAEVLESIGPPAASAVGPLIRLLESKQLTLVPRAARTLGAIGPSAQKAVKPMIAVLADARDESVKQQIILALGGIGPEAREAVPELRKLLNRSGPKVQAMAAHTLGAIGKDAGAAIPELTALLKSREPTVQVYAAQALWKIANRVEEALPVLLDILERKGEENDVFRQAAAQTLGAIGAPALVAVPALDDCRMDPSEKVKAAAAAALEAIGPPEKEEVDRLINGLKSTHLRYRIECTRALTMAGQDRKDAISDLLSGLKDTDDRVRVASALALKSIVPGAPKDSMVKAVAALIEALNEGTMSLRAAVIEALGALGQDAKEALGPLRGLLKKTEVKQQLLILDAIAEMKDDAKDTVPDLIGLLHDKAEKDLRAAAAFTLGRIGPAASAAVDALKARLEDPDGGVRLHAAHSLNNITALNNITPDRILKLSVPVLARCLFDDEPGIRANAAQALGEIGPKVLTIDRKVTVTLEELRRSREPYVREKAETALRSIDPKKLRR